MYQVKEDPNPYVLYLDIMNTGKDVMKSEYSSLKELEKYLGELQSGIHSSNEKVDEKQFLRQKMIDCINMPYLSDQDEAKIIEEATKIGLEIKGRQIRDFFRNQRLRKIKKIVGLIKADIETILQNSNCLDRDISCWLSRYEYQTPIKTEDMTVDYFISDTLSFFNDPETQQ